MIRPHLARVKIRIQRAPCLSSQLHISTIKSNLIKTKNGTSTLRSPGYITLIPEAQNGQFVSEEAVNKATVITYEQANELLNEGLVKRRESPYRMVLLKLLELELLKVSVLRYDQINQLIKFVIKIRAASTRNPGLVVYLERNLGNIAINVFKLIYYSEDSLIIMNKFIKLLLKEDIPADTKLQNLYKLMDLYSHIMRQLVERGFKRHALLVMQKRNFDQIYKILHRGDYLVFYLKLLEYDCINISTHVFSKLRYELKNGSDQEQEAYEFGALLTLEDSEAKNFMKKKFLTLYSFHMMKEIVVKYIQLGETEKSEFYLEYFFAKYAMEKKRAQKKKQHELTTILYEVVTYHSVRLKHYESAIALLETIKSNNIPITPKLIHILTTSFTKKKMFDAVLTVLNKTASILQDQEIDNRYKNLLAVELLIALRQKYPDNPKLIVSQFMSIYQGSEVMLNQLGILSLLYDDSVAEFGDLTTVTPLLYKTEISDFFKITDGFPVIQVITELYITILNYVGMHQSDVQLETTLRALFSKFQDYVIKVQELKIREHPFSKDKLDEGLLNVFVKRTIFDAMNPTLALFFLKSFLRNCNFIRFDGYAASMIIYYHKNMEPHALDEAIGIIKKLERPLGFYAMTAIILRKDSMKDYEGAHEWYKKLLKLEKPINHFDLVQVINKHEWELPEDFDHNLLKTKYMTADERRELELLAQDDEINEDFEFIGKLDKAFDKLIQK